MKHTKRPWNLSKSTGNIIAKENGQLQIVCKLAIGQQAQFGPIKMPPQVEANAWLIEAAPDLLEACKAIIGDKPDKYGYGAASNAMNDDIRASLRDAIAKAEKGVK